MNCEYCPYAENERNCPCPEKKLIDDLHSIEAKKKRHENYEMGMFLKKRKYRFWGGRHTGFQIERK